MNNACAICGANNWGANYWFFSTLNKSFFNKVFICKDCGHGQIVPMYSEARISQNNDRFLGKKYTGVHRTENINNEKIQVLEERLSSINLSGSSVLDIGAGEAWSKPFFDAKLASYSAIEPIDELRKNIESIGCTVIAKNIYDVDESYYGKYDVIVFRHILEHLSEPRKALEILRNLLSDQGHIYLAVPNAAQPDERKGFRTSYLRPVHVHYFRYENLKRLAASIGLQVVEYYMGRELFLLLQKDTPSYGETRSFYCDQKQIFDNALGNSFIRDYTSIVKQGIKLVLGRG